MRPKHRPPRPKHPKFTHFHRSGLRFGRFPAQRRSIGGVGRHRRAWLRCRWAAAGPGRASRRRTKPHVSTPGTTGVEGTGGICRSASGRRQGQGGPRDRPLRAQLACGRSRGRAAAHRHTQRPDPTKQPGPTSQARRRPEHPWGPQAARPSGRPTTATTRRPRRAARAGTGRGSG